MATVTPNLNLELPLGTENVSRQLINSNNTKIDTFAGEVQEKFDNIGTKIQEIIDDTAGEGDTDKVWSADKSAKEVTDLKADIDEKADPICKTIDTPASIITIEDGADDLPVREMRIAIEPVQDLHGYENPWPGGGGKNLCHIDQIDFLPIATWVNLENGNANTITNGTKIHLKAGDYYFGLTDASNINTFQVFDSSGNTLRNGTEGTFTLSEEQDIYIRFRAADNTVALKFKIQIETGTSKTDWTPYSNICPITGWTGAKVTRTGKNLYHGKHLYEKSYISSTGEVKPLNDMFVTEYIPVTGGEKYTISFINEKSGFLQNVIGYNANHQFLQIVHGFSSSSAGTLLNATITMPANVAFITMNTLYGDTNLQVIKGEYVPFDDQVYSITFPSEAGTVYGGTLTVEKDGSGTLVVDRGIEVITSESPISKTTSTVFYLNKNVPMLKTLDYIGKLVCDRLVVRQNHGVMTNNFSNVPGITGYADLNNTYPNQNWIYLTNGVDTTTTDIKAWLANNPLTVVYTLATPITYQLTAPQVRTLLGLNHILADTGNVELLTYPVDTAIALDNQTANTQGIIAGTDSLVVTENHAIGDVFICDNKLYKAIDAIAIGESIIEGSNVEQTTVADELNAIWGSIATGVSF